ncbi:MAG: undecaprenyl/decaprenyl-phosphate alpha-N-acetylglucosaminyl 1-phosphate transferase [Candidatus Edwardsbacteria bacterium]|jgi:UDP-GlcNAc:undecaprenyl-phosphate GlcNAc-1-phosphate transferase|nr:undecaprenyl/decaprenyl-phosphate alpha-N-acetylglucosaminyl 1-phosphate transferase [Candidatus Edwardsbacteria bacterium]
MSILIDTPAVRYLALLLVAALTTRVLMPLAHIMGRRMNAWDAPDDLSHSGHVFRLARTGGIAIVGGIYVGNMVAVMLQPELFATRDMAAMMLGGAAVFVVGLLDDLREIAPWLKAVLLVAASVATVMMMTAVALTGYERLDFLLAALALMGGANAFNLMDGLDGLAAGMAVAACLGLLALSLRLQTFEGGSVKLICIGAALGFLYYNRPPAGIFMGDCGSLPLGFYLAVMGLNTVRSGPASFVPVLLVLSPFALDTGLAVVRRLLLRRDVFSGDRRHIYDLLHERITSVWRVDWIMWSLGLAFSGLGLAATWLAVPWQLALLAFSWTAAVLWMAALGMFAPEARTPGSAS